MYMLLVKMVQRIEKFKVVKQEFIKGQSDDPGVYIYSLYGILDRRAVTNTQSYLLLP